MVVYIFWRMCHFSFRRNLERMQCELFFVFSYYFFLCLLGLVFTRRDAVLETPNAFVEQSKMRHTLSV